MNRFDESTGRIWPDHDGGQVLLVVDDNDAFGEPLALRLGRLGRFRTQYSTGFDPERTVETFVQIRPQVVLLDRKLGPDERGGDALAQAFRDAAEQIRRRARKRGADDPYAQYRPWIILHTSFAEDRWELIDRELIDEVVVIGHTDEQSLLAHVRQGFKRSREGRGVVPRSREWTRVLLHPLAGGGSWVYERTTGRCYAPAGLNGRTIEFAGFQRVIIEALAERLNVGCTSDELVDRVAEHYEERIGTDDREFSRRSITHYVNEIREKLRRAMDVDAEVVNEILPRGTRDGRYVLFGTRVD